jgi:hypothetical protein
MERTSPDRRSFAARAMDVAVVVPVGPGAPEEARAEDVVASVRRYEPDVPVLLVDDAGGALRPPLAALVRTAPGAAIVAPGHRRRHATLGGLGAVMLFALGWAWTQLDPDVVVKLDTDALVIAPFAAAIADAVRRRPGGGIFGAFDRTSNGEPRDFSPHHACIRRALSRWHLSRAARRRRGHIRAALAAGYRSGEHCLGGAYAVSRALLARMATAGAFDDGPLWRGTRFAEDVVMGLYARALGLDLVNLNGEGEPFGVKWLGLADTPPRLVERGFAIIHSVKGDRRFAEAAVRAYFRRRRAA